MCNLIAFVNLASYWNSVSLLLLIVCMQKQMTRASRRLVHMLLAFAVSLRATTTARPSAQQNAEGKAEVVATGFLAVIPEGELAH